MTGRVDGQLAFVLHTHPYRETSLILDVFSRDYGRVALVARGARRPRAALRGLIMGFQPLELGWTGKGEVLTLMKAEWLGGQPLLGGRALLCGYYLNELLLALLPREDAHERLFEVYRKTLLGFAAGVQEADLRRFEKALLQELGYGLTLDRDAEGRALDPDAPYAYEIERGPVRLTRPGQSPLCVRGRTLLDLHQDDFAATASAQEAKQLMRAMISHYLGGGDLTTRKLFKELQDL